MKRDRSVLSGVALLVAALGVAGPAVAQPAVGTLPNGPFRNLDGTGNNQAHPQWGAAHTRLLQSTPMAYDDGVSAMSGVNRPSPREISNAVIAQPDVPLHPRASNFVWMWGQFLDHDLDLTETQSLSTEPFCAEVANVLMPSGDPVFDPDGTGTAAMGFCRSAFDPLTGTDTAHPRAQTNSITSYIDGSNVYGSDDARALALRKNDGSGELKTTAGPGGGALPPFNTTGLPNAVPGPQRYLCGDVRCEENTNLLSMHSLWIREHNTWARKIRQRNSGLTDEQIYQRARMIVSAELQAITYNEFLPMLLGAHAIPTYGGYKADVNAGIDVVFSTASFRFGHSMLTHTLKRLNSRLNPIPGGDLLLQQAFFNPAAVTASGGIEPFLRGAAHQHANRVDAFVIDDVRNFLVNGVAEASFDLGTLNIQRGRDHGLPGYNDLRIAYGLAPRSSLAAINPDPRVSARLAEAYTSVEDVDPWVGGISEAPVRGGIVGELVRTVLADQFTRTRDGDRFYYENVFPQSWVTYFKQLRFSDVIVRNTKIRANEIPANVFVAR